MSTKIIDFKERKELQPAHGLWQLYAPQHAPYRFQAGTPQQAVQWQQKTRPALNKTLDFESLPKTLLSPHKI